MGSKRTIKDYDIWLVLPNFRNYRSRFQTFIHVASMFREGNIVLVDEFSYPSSHQIPANVKVYPIKSWKYLKLFRFALKILKNKRKVIVHDTFWSKLGIFVGIFNFFRKPVIFSFSSYFPCAEFYLKGVWQKYARKNIWWMERAEHVIFTLLRVPLEFISCRFSHNIIGNSIEILDGMKKFYNAKAMMFSLPASVDTNFWMPVEVKPSVFPDGENIFKILYVGSIRWRKGLITLIDALDRCSNRLAEFRLYIVGGKNNFYDYYEKQKFFREIDRRNIAKHIRVIDRLPPEELRKYYCDADVFVSPSYYEGSPRTVGEAMACGCPVIASDIAGIEILDQEHRWIKRFKIRFEDTDKEKLADCLCEFWKERDQWQKKRGEIRNWTLNSFAPEIIAEKIKALYKQVLLADKYKAK